MPKHNYRWFDVNMVGNASAQNLPAHSLRSTHAEVVPVNLRFWTDLQRFFALSFVAMAWLAVSASAVQVRLLEHDAARHRTLTVLAVADSTKFEGFGSNTGSNPEHAQILNLNVVCRTASFFRLITRLPLLTLHPLQLLTLLLWHWDQTCCPATTAPCPTPSFRT